MMFATLISFLYKISGDMFKQDRHILVHPFAKKTLNEETAISESASCVSFTRHENQEDPELESSDESALESVVTKPLLIFGLISSIYIPPIRLSPFVSKAHHLITRSSISMTIPYGPIYPCSGKLTHTNSIQNSSPLLSAKTNAMEPSFDYSPSLLIAC